MPAKNVLVISELLKLPTFRLQGIYLLDGHILILECYFKQHGKYFLVIDRKVRSQSLYLSNNKPLGDKKLHPIVQATKKYCLGKAFDILTSDEKLILSSPSSHIVIDLSKIISVGLFVNNKLMAALGPAENITLLKQPESLPLTKSFELTNNKLEAVRHQKLIREDYLILAIKNLQKLINKKKLLEARLLEDLERCQNVIAKENEALLLQSNYNLLKKGQEHVILTNYFSKEQGPIKILLDKNKTAKENIEQKFNKIKKAKRGVAAIKPRLEIIRSEISKLSEGLNSLKNTGNNNILSQEIFSPKNYVPQKAGDEKRLPYNKYLSSDGLEILVGKSAKDSDFLSLKIAKGNNWWFHVKDFVGAHVIVRYEKDDLLPNTFIEAAMLAIHFSKAKDSSRAEVIYTRAKYLKKPKGLKPGALLVSQEKSRLIDVDERKIKSLIKK